MSSERGFTLIELVVVMGILTIFASFLVQLTSTSVGLFQDGERGQDLADRADAAASTVHGALDGMVGPGGLDLDGQAPSTRLVVQWVPLVGPAATPGVVREKPPYLGTRVQVLRATVQIDGETEADLLRPFLLQEAAATAVATTPAAIGERLAELLAEAPRGGRAQMLLIARPAGDADGAFFDLRRILLLPGQLLEVPRNRQVDMMAVPQVGSPDLPWPVIDAHSSAIAHGLLHVEYALWSQFTRSWNAQVGQGGPEYAWDSARAGLFTEADEARAVFGMDVGPDSLRDLSDDVFPRWLAATVVVASNFGSEALLADDLRAGERMVRVLDEARLPDVREAPYVKIGSEWVRYTSVENRTLRGLQRGQRGTKATDHPAGTRVRVGRTIELFVRLAHGKDCWNAPSTR